MGDFSQLINTLYNVNPITGLCNRGPYDGILVAFFTVLILSFRVFFYTKLCPFLLKNVKISAGKRGIRKFTEQAWMFMCHSISLYTGCKLLVGTKYTSAVFGYSSGTTHFWIGYPLEHKNLTIGFKTFYFVELAYWMHFVVALIYEHYERYSYQCKIAKGIKAEEPFVRKDFWALVVHHAVTVLLVGTSYYMNFIRIGHVTMILLDVSDVLLCFAKMLNYLPSVHHLVKEIIFGIFAISWVLTRHYLLGILCLSIYSESLVHVPKEALLWDPYGIQAFYSLTVYWSFLGLFAILQALLLYWLWMILRIVIQIALGGPPVDDRSDNDEEITTPDTITATEKKPRKSKKELNNLHEQVVKNGSKSTSVKATVTKTKSRA